MGKSGTCKKCGEMVIFANCKICPKGGNRQICCKYGDECFKGCEQGTSCQKWCKRNMECARSDCKYAHSEGWNAFANQKPCRDGNKCNRTDCWKFFSHPWDLKEQQTCTIIQKPQPQPQPQPQPLVIVTPLSIYNYNGRVQYNYIIDGVAVSTTTEVPKLTEEQLNIFGTAIYPFIQSVIPGQVGKITGMILDSFKRGGISFEEMAGYTKNQIVNQSLVDKINEALKILQNQ